MASEKILIVDDNITNLKLIKVLLTLEGYQVDTAMDAMEAKEYLKKHLDQLPDLILMDIQLPGMDGLTLTRELRDTEEYKNLMIVAVTTYTFSGDKERAFEAGCDGYIPKPIDTQTLGNVIEGYLQKRRK